MQESSWFGFDDLFWLTLFVLFASALVGALLRRMRKDRCLRLFDDFHVTLLNKNGTPEWGDVRVSGDGIELVFDVPHTTRYGLVKASHLVTEAELQSGLAMARSVYALAPEELAERAAQIRRTFNPGPVRRSLRRLANLRDMVSDSIGKSLTLVLGSVSGPLGSAMASRKGEVNELGKTLAGVVTNAYEPLLERHIGKEVVIEVQNPEGASTPSSEFAGYLVDYTDKYIAVFNVTQVAESRRSLPVNTYSDESCSISCSEHTATFSCLGPAALVLHGITPIEHKDDQTKQRLDLDITLLPGCSVELQLPAASCEVDIEQTFRCDLICPRSRAIVRYGSSSPATNRLHASRWHGIAPKETAEETD